MQKMTNKKFETGLEETKKGYKINPIRLGLFQFFFGILIPIILLISAGIFSMTWVGNLLGILFFVYMVFIVTWSIKKRISFLRSMAQKGRNQYNYHYESKGLFKQKELIIKK